MTRNRTFRFGLLSLPLAATVLCGLQACDTRTTKEKTETTTKKETPEGTKTTTETHERKTETTPKP